MLPSQGPSKEALLPQAIDGDSWADPIIRQFIANIGLGLALEILQKAVRQGVVGQRLGSLILQKNYNANAVLDFLDTH